MANPAPYPAIPRWVKISGVISAVLLLCVIVLMFVGEPGSHGPWRHMGSQVTEPGSQQP